MQNKKTLAICSLVLSIISLIPIIITPNSINGAEIFATIGIILAIAATILGFISKKDGKGLAIAGVVIGIISCIILCLSLIGFSAIKKATDCVDNGNDTSTCQFMDQNLEVPNSLLREDQKK